MSSFSSDFDDKVAEITRRLGEFNETMSSLPHTSRFVCEKGLERRDGYMSRSPKFYVFRKGQQWPDYLVPVKFSPVKLRCGHIMTAEALRTAEVDIRNNGYNAFINVPVERLIDRRTDYVTGFPALLVGKHYRGDVNLLAEHCSDDFQRATYCTVCTPELDDCFEAALYRQSHPQAAEKPDEGMFTFNSKTYIERFIAHQIWERLIGFDIRHFCLRACGVCPPCRQAS